jgi:hypothetical protein
MKRRRQARHNAAFKTEANYVAAKGTQGRKKDIQKARDKKKQHATGGGGLCKRQHSALIMTCTFTLTPTFAAACLHDPVRCALTPRVLARHRWLLWPGQPRRSGFSGLLFCR